MAGSMGNFWSGGFDPNGAGRSLCALAVGAFLCSGCLEPNEGFDEALIEGADCEVDDAHPNHTLDDAAPLGAIPERADPRRVAGRLTLPGEADWYRLEGYLSGNETTVRLEVQAAIDLRVCAFVTCAQPQVDLNCSSVQDERGRLGCCDVGDLFMPFRCPSDDAVELHLRVDGGEACTFYDLEYRL